MIRARPAAVPEPVAASGAGTVGAHFWAHKLRGEVAMARTSMRGWPVISLLVLSVAGLPLWSVPAAAQDREEQQTAAPAGDDPFGIPAESQDAAPPSADNDPFGDSPQRAVAVPALAHAGQGPSDLESESKIRHQLAQPTIMEFIETPLAQVVDFLKDLHGIEIQLDKKSLEEAGIGTDTPITITVQGISLESGLCLMLRPLDMTYVVRHGVMLVTTQAAVRKIVELRVYDVHDLLGEDVDVRDVLAILQLVLDPEVASTDQQPVPKAPRAAQAARATCTATSQAHPFGELLVVRASIVQQKAIEDLLNDVRRKLNQANN
jgi:hypothetical protein